MAPLPPAGSSLLAAIAGSRVGQDDETERVRHGVTRAHPGQIGRQGGTMATRRKDPGAPRALGYVRVSTDEQKASGAGLEAQRSAITEACRVRGYALLDIIEDAGVSGKSLEREGVRRALAELDAGRADVLVVNKLDRLSRSLLDFAGLVERAKQRGWQIVALDNGGSDMTTPNGEALAGMTAVFAQLERRLIADRTRAGMAAKRAQGARFGRRSADRIPAEVLDRIVRERAEGRKLQAIADGLNADGVPTARPGVRLPEGRQRVGVWQRATIHAALQAAVRERERQERLRGRIVAELAGGAPPAELAKRLTEEHIPAPNDAPAWTPETVAAVTERPS